MSTNNLFPLLYQAQHRNYLEDLPFWNDLAAAQGSPVLELGCGSGRVLLPFAQAGYHVVGIDNDFDMLALLKSQISAGLKSRVKLLMADVAHIPLAGRFSLVVMPCNTLSILTRQAQADVLRGVCALLVQNGLFAVSLPNPELLRRLPRRAEPDLEDTFPHPQTGEPVQVSSSWIKSANELIVTWHYDHLLPHGEVERLTSQVRHRLDSVGEYHRAFNTAGLQIEQLYGDFDHSPYRPDSESLIILARPVTFL